MWRRALLALGSNLGDRAAYLQDAVDGLSDDRSIRVVAASPVYETAPLGPSEEAFLNAVIEIATDLEPHELLERCHDCENVAGRVRTERWGARTLDVDIIWMEDVTLDDATLTIPHAEASQRLFVLIPLRDLDPVVASELSEVPLPEVSELPSDIATTAIRLRVERRA